MATTDQLLEIEERLAALGDQAHLASAADVALSRLDNLLPVASISTKDFHYTKRWIPNALRQPIRVDRRKTPYMDGVLDACDTPGVRVVALKGPARFSKTLGFESKAVKNWTYGPLVNMLWLMQTKDDRDVYVDERVTWMLDNHEEVAEKIDPSDPKNGRSRVDIGGALAFWLPATLQNLRGKAAPFIVGDEIDAYAKRVRNAIKTLVLNRQREFGSNALACFCSHPDAGPTEGIDDIIAMGLKHMWWWLCPACNKPSSPSVEAEFRMTWNVPQLLEAMEDMDREELLDMIERDARLVCPHCDAKIDEDGRRDLGGVWLQPHQSIDEHGEILGEPRVAKTMGFEGHAFMAPFAPLGELARGWAEAWIKFVNTQDTIDLKEQTVKSLGETFAGAKPEEQIDPPKIVKARLQQGYNRGKIPPGVVFLTAFVDVQGNRFEVVVIGWDLRMRSWLVDRYPLIQWAGFETINPAHRLTDWRIIEHAIIHERFEFQNQPGLYLPVAKVMVNGSGQPGVTNMARLWMSEAIAQRRFEPWQVTVFQGAASKTSEPYGHARQVDFDDSGKALPVPVFERTLNVHAIKKVIALRMKVEDPNQPGRMALPFDVKQKHVNELCSEKFVNNEWVQTGANETWDGWVACEAARFLLRPERPELWNDRDPATGSILLPTWARPIAKDAPVVTPAQMDAQAQMDYFSRLAEINRRNQ